MPARKIIDLRHLLAERFPEEPPALREKSRTGVRTFDQALAGGLTKSRITELSCTTPHAGSATLIALLLERAARERSFLALIDGRDSFDPESSGRALLPHLLWVRCQQAREALQAADWLLRDGNFPLIILDLALNSLPELRRLPQSNWYRLQRLVEIAPSALLVLTPQSMISSAQWKLTLENRWTLPQLEEERKNLCGHLRFGVKRTQPNEWKSAQKVARAS